MTRNPLYRSADTSERNDRRDMLVGGAVLALAEGGIAAVAVMLADVLGPEVQAEAAPAEPMPARRAGPDDGDIALPDDRPRHGPAASPQENAAESDADHDPGSDASDDLASLFAYDDGVPDDGGVWPSRQDPVAARMAHGLSGPNGGVAPAGGAGPSRGAGAASPLPDNAGGGDDGHGGDAGDGGGDQPPDDDPDRAPWTLRLGTDDGNAVFGTAGDDYVFGRDGDDMLFGGAGNDRLLAGSGDDDLIGGAGNDFLAGGKGDDRLAGGAGDDVFIFRAGFGDDVVSDFDNRDEHDLIELARGEFAGFAAVEQALADTPAGVVLTHDDGSTLTLLHVFKADLSADDFHFVV